MLCLFFIFLSPLLVQPVLSDECPKDPITLNSSYVFSQDVAAPGSSCDIQIVYEPYELNNATFALLSISATGVTDNSDFIFITDYYGTKVRAPVVGGSIDFTLSIPPPRFSISIQAGQNSKMVVVVTVNQRHYYPFSAQRQQSATVSLNTPASLYPLNKLKRGMTTVISSFTEQTYLTVAVPLGVIPPSLMNLFVYDGPLQDAVLVGTLYNAILSKKLVSVNRIFTIYCASEVTLDGVIMATDTSNVKQFSNYDVYWSDAKSIDIFAGDTPSAATILGNLDYSNSIWVENIGLGKAGNTLSTLLAYPQTPLGDLPNAIVEYNQNTLATALPQFFDSFARTFVVKKGHATLTFTPKAQEWTPFNGRTGFIASQDFGLNSANQNSSTFRMQGNFLFTVELLVYYIGTDTQLTIFNDGTTNVVPLTAQLLNNPFQLYGKNIGVTIGGKGNTASKGTLIYFTVKTDDDNTGNNPKPTGAVTQKPGGVKTTTPDKGSLMVSGFTSVLCILFSRFI